MTQTLATAPSYARARALAVAALTTSLIAFTLVLASVPPAWASETFGVEKFENSITANAEGAVASQAGSHPYAITTTIEFYRHAAKHEGEEQFFPNGGDVKGIEVNLPVGVIVNPTATTTCTEAQVEHAYQCPNAAAVGVATLHTNRLPTVAAPVFNVVPPPGAPAELAFNVLGQGLVVHIPGGVRTGKDYGLSADVLDVTQKLALYATKLTLWGNPADASHNALRGSCLGIYGESLGSCPVEGTGRPFLTLPSSCAEPLVATVRAISWPEPENWTPVRGSSPAVPALTGCGRLDFSPSLVVQPQPYAAAVDSPSGLSVDLKLPQQESVLGLAEADLKDAVVTLPAGMAVSPSAANGLGACTLEEIGLNNASPPSCPDSSKLGSVQIVTPLLAAPLEGSVFLAQQGNLPGNGSNPFGSLLALYVVAEGSGASIKLAGEVALDPVTGQLTVRFGEDPITTLSTGERQFLPQLPFSDLKMSFFGGPRAALVTPASCGSYTASSRLTPWSGTAPAEPASGFTIATGCGGGAFNPSFTAGTPNNQAGAFSPFTVTISRRDGERRLGSVQVTAPPGLLGVLKSVARCPEPQASQGACGPESLIGETTVAAGPGADPLWVRGGRVYLTGPYKGAPFGLSIAVPALAGPFNLGDNGAPVIVRAQINVDPHTAQITVTSDPLPTILQGVPLDIRTINVTVNRSGFMFNPTNCSALAVTGVVGSTSGAGAGVSSPFEAANCANLPFKARFTALTDANTSKVGGAYLHVKVVSGSGQANIGKVRVELPKQLPSRLSTLQKACVAGVFEANPAACPPGSVVGSATAVTRLLARPLSGPAYLVSHGGVAFPDLEIVLQGEGITLVLDGNTNIKNAITSSTFKTVPDAPISTFDLLLPEGPHSVLAAYGSLCKTPLDMPTTITGQNGAVIKQTTRIAVSGCPKAKKKAKPGKKGKGKKK